METNTYNLLATFLTILVILVSVISMVISIVHAKITTDVAIETQKIAKRALDIEAFRYKKEVAPSLYLKYELTVDMPKYGKKVYIRIRNESFGKAIIESVKASGHLSSFVTDSSLPFELMRNGKLDYIGEISNMMYQEDAIHDNTDEYAKLANFGLAHEISERYKREFNRIMLQSFFVVSFRDILGTLYEVTLTLAGNGTGIFIGEPTEKAS